MRKLARVLLVGGSILAALAAAGALVVLVISDQRLGRTFTVSPQPIDFPTDSDSISHGKDIAQNLCADCHGDDLSGGETYSLGPRGDVTAGNLTSGEGGIGGSYSDLDWIRAIHYGVRPDGKGLFMMPSDRFGRLLDDAQLGMLIAYLKSMPPVDNTAARPNLSLVGRVDYLSGNWPTLLIAEMLNVDTPPD